jgi:eukaryotic-like serine/threonine-protein kinase
MPDALPAQIGSYPVRGLIGTGSMGMVFLGHDPVIDRPVAIKTIHRRLLETAGTEQNVAARFRVEAQAAGRLNHRNIVSVYQFGEDAENAFIVMEYVAGHSLRDYLKRSERFSVSEVQCLMGQLLDALHFAHERGVVHRDIKPANLIVADDGRLKITDFGIARTESSQVTRANAVVGSPGYIAPEQYTGDAQDRRVDVFSAGVLLYQLLTGSLPFSGSDESIMYQIVYEQHQPLEVRSGDPALAVFEPIIVRALAKDPAQRFASARAFAEALQALSAEPVAEMLPRNRLMPPRPRAGAAPAASAAGPGSSAGSSAGARSGSGAGPAPVSGFGPGSSPGSGPASGGSHPSVPPVPTGWDETALAGLERELARHVGPVARVLVRRAARGQTELEAVRRAVAGAITDPVMRERFLADHSPTSPGTGPRSSASGFGSSLFGHSAFGASGFGGQNSAAPADPSAGLNGSALQADDVAKASAALTRLLGPIAKVMVKQCAARSSTRDQLVARVLEQLSPGADAKQVQAELWRAFT